MIVKRIELYMKHLHQNSRKIIDIFTDSQCNIRVERIFHPSTNTPKERKQVRKKTIMLLLMWEMIDSPPTKRAAGMIFQPCIYAMDMETMVT